MTKNIQLIIGSTRDGRTAPAIADWVKNNASQHEELNIEVVDLKDIALPFFQAATPPAYGADDSEHAQNWAKKVSEADGYIFLTPEYNRSIPASLKNALDYLVAEWNGKPAAVVSYGFIDGGMSANKHLHDVLSWLKVATVDTTVAIHLKQEMFSDTGLKDVEADFAQYEESLRDALTQLANAEEPVPATA